MSMVEPSVIRTPGKRLSFAVRMVCTACIMGLSWCQAEPYHSMLRQHHVPADRPGLEAFLSSIAPSAEQKKNIAHWIEALGDDHFRVRRDAEQRLTAISLFRRASLAPLRKSTDPEIKIRTERILGAHQDVDRDALLYSVLKVLETNAVPVEASLLLNNVPHAHTPWLFQAFTDHLARQTINPSLRGTLAASTNEQSRAMYMLYAEDLAVLADGLVHPAPRVNLAAAYQLSRRGETLGREALGALLDSEDPTVRASAGRMLASLAIEPAAYYPYAALEIRRAQMASWQKRIDDPQAWVQPDDFPPLFLHKPLLLARGYSGGVIELDPSGQVIWDYNIRGAWNAERMQNGNTLIASYSERRVVEVTSGGEEVWEFKTPNLNARPLKNGNVLIACYSDNRVAEVRKSDDEVVWEYQTPGRAHDAIMLGNGNVLMCWEKGVREVNRAGEIAWEWLGGGDRSRFYSVQRLPDGNTLVSDYGMSRVVEITEHHDVTWQMEVPRPSDAYRLPNGNTLITSSKEHMEVTPGLEVIWRKSGARSGSARK
ncbi:MAG: hypothetical protein ACI9QL_003317 [Candidatus Omnitrophota bacterium]